MLWIGRREAIGIGRETIRGTGVAPAYWLNALSKTFADRADRIKTEGSFGGIWGGDQSPVALKFADGEFDVELSDQSFGMLLYALLGSLSTTDNADGSYQHNFSLANTNAHTSLSIHTIDPIGQLLYKLSMIDSMEITIEPDSVVHLSVTFMSKNSASSSGQTASFNAEKKFIGRHLGFKLGATTADLDAASNISLKSLTVRFEKNTSLNQVMSTVQPEDIPNTRFNVNGSFVLDYQDRTYRDLILDGSYRAMRVDLTHGDIIPGGGTNPYQFRLDLSKCDLDGFDPSFDMDDIVSQNISFNALYDAGGNDNVINSCYLVNAVDSY